MLNINIIYIQCETLFDMTYVIPQSWSENPLEYLDTLSGECYVGDLITPMVGGGTCNVEYEMLTGYSYYNVNGTPFVSGLTAGETSLVSDLNDYGYESRDKSKPYFAHVVTTQNHGAYTTDYDGYGITVDGDIIVDANRQLQTYLNLEKESMEALKYLLDYFASVDDDVIVVFWGDHCPSLNLFDIQGDTVEYVVNSHKTPLVVWNNYGQTFDFGESITAYQFTPRFMQELGMRIDSFMNYSADNDVPTTVVGSIVLNSDGTYADFGQMSEEERELWNNLWLLQYDREYGKGYSVGR